MHFFPEAFSKRQGPFVMRQRQDTQYKGALDSLGWEIIIVWPDTLLKACRTFTSISVHVDFEASVSQGLLQGQMTRTANLQVQSTRCVPLSTQAFFLRPARSV